jgi:hypothetical protein
VRSRDERKGELPAFTSIILFLSLRTSSRSAHLSDALSSAYDVLGFDEAAGGDEMFRLLVLARIVRSTPD